MYTSTVSNMFVGKLALMANVCTCMFMPTLDLPSIFQDKSPTSKIQNLLLFVTNITNQSEILFLISVNLFLILISMLILLSREIVKIQNMFINQPDI